MKKIIFLIILIWIISIVVNFLIPWAKEINFLIKNVNQENISRNISVGVFMDDEYIQKFESENMVNFDHVLLFQDIDKIQYSEVRRYLDAGYEVILNLEFEDNYPNLEDISRGKYDKYLEQLAKIIKEDGRHIWLRPLHEFNGDWYNWSVFYNGNSSEDFQIAWKHVVTIFREESAPVKFQMNYNRKNGKDDPTPFKKWWVGDEWVDMVVITSYNRAYTDEWHQEWREFREDFDFAYQEIIALTNKPIGVAEMSSTSYGGKKPQWIYNAMRDIKLRYPKVEQVTWFAHNKTVGNIELDWNLNTLDDIYAFTAGYDLLKQKEMKWYEIFSPLRISSK